MFITNAELDDLEDAKTDEEKIKKLMERIESLSSSLDTYKDMLRTQKVVYLKEKEKKEEASYYPTDVKREVISICRSSLENLNPLDSNFPAILSILAGFGK